jgi:hypothetical protein
MLAVVVSGSVYFLFCFVFGVFCVLGLAFCFANNHGFLCAAYVSFIFLLI